jgi:hypothetical protein
MGSDFKGDRFLLLELIAEKIDQSTWPGTFRKWLDHQFVKRLLRYAQGLVLMDPHPA